jgi:hypothetical protein
LQPPSRSLKPSPEDRRVTPVLSIEWHFSSNADLLTSQIVVFGYPRSPEDRRVTPVFSIEWHFSSNADLLTSQIVVFGYPRSGWFVWSRSLDWRRMRPLRSRVFRREPEITHHPLILGECSPGISEQCYGDARAWKVARERRCCSLRSIHSHHCPLFC